MSLINKQTKYFISIGVVLCAVCSAGTASAINADSQLVQTQLIEQTNTEPALKSLNNTRIGFRNIAQNSNASFRSKSEVMSEVKARYNAKVLKITLNENTASYSVRALLPNGKVKNLRISARK